MQIFFICKDKFCFYHYRESYEYMYITESWLLGEIYFYSERGLAEGKILHKVTVLQINIKLPHICPI